MARAAADSKTPPKLGGRWLGAGCLMLFALPFAAGGTVVAGWVASDLWQWNAARSWTPTPALLLEAGLDRGRHPTRGSTSRATARYRYTFGGKNYQGDRVSLHAGRDNIGAYHEDRARELRRIKAGNKQLTCYVNPEAPSEAVLFRDLRWGLLLLKLVFALVFCAIGFGLLVGAALAPGSESARRQRAADHPDQPWLWDKKWASPRLRAENGLHAVGMTIFAALWNAISVPGFAMVYAHPERGAPNAIWIMAIFPLVGAGLAVAAAYLWIRRLKWGVPEFELASLPGVLGGPLAGVVQAPAAIDPRDSYVVRLSCIKEVDQGSDSSKKKRLWEHEYEIDRELSSGARTMIPIEFLIPSDLPPSGDDVTWKLETRAATRGVDFYSEFDVPVFKTAASRPVTRDEAEAATPKSAAHVDFAAIVRSLGAVVDRDDPSGGTLLFPMTRNLGLSLFLATFAIGWTGITVFLARSDAPRIFPWVFGAFNVVLILAAASTCFSRTRLSFNSRGVARRGGLFGLGRRFEYPAAQIADVFAQKSGTTWGDREYRRVRLRPVAGKPVTLVSEIARPRNAERLAQEIRQAIGLTKEQHQEKTSRVSLESKLPVELGGE